MAKTIAALEESSGLRDGLLFFTREKHWINEQQLQVCRIPAATFFEERRAEWMLAQFRALGWEAQMDRGGNVVAHQPGFGAGPFVALTAHLDTVLAPRNPEEIHVTPDGRMHGPGIADNGSGLSALLAIARAYPLCPELTGNPHSLLLVANVGEEGEGNLSGMRHLCRQSPLGSRIRSFLVLDGPTTDHITCQALASRRYEVSFSGPGGHSWSDSGVGNPVHALARAITLYSEAHAALPALPRLSFNFGMIEGGLSVNSIPASARAKLDVRSENPARLDESAAALSQAIEQALEIENERSAAGRVSAKAKEIGARPGGKLKGDSPLLATLKAVDAFLGIRAHLDCASTDANVPLSMGLPAVSIGSGGSGGGAHTVSEWFHPEGRERGLKRILLTLALLLREPAEK
jgi:acetylornithine deacetylase/succinyl-diaminopimelate desuccinylase-like protein